MRKYPIKVDPKVYALIFGIMILIGLVLCTMLVYRWRDSVRSEAQYKVAPLCTSPEQSGCRHEIESVVKNTYFTSGRNKTTHYVSLLMPSSNLNGDIPVWWETDHSLYSLLKPGDRVTAEEWEGQTARARHCHLGRSRTQCTERSGTLSVASVRNEEHRMKASSRSHCARINTGGG